MQTLKGFLSAAFVGALLLSALGAHADDKPNQDHQKCNRFEMLKKKLNLSSDQVAQWRQVDKDRTESAKILRDRCKADEAQLAVLVDEKASDQDLTGALSVLEADRHAVTENREKFFGNLKKILNPTQQAKAVLMMASCRNGKATGKSCKSMDKKWQGDGDDRTMGQSDVPNNGAMGQTGN